MPLLLATFRVRALGVSGESIWRGTPEGRQQNEPAILFPHIAARCNLLLFNPAINISHLAELLESDPRRRNQTVIGNSPHCGARPPARRTDLAIRPEPSPEAYRFRPSFEDEHSERRALSSLVQESSQNTHSARPETPVTRARRAASPAHAAKGLGQF